MPAGGKKRECYVLLAIRNDRRSGRYDLHAGRCRDVIHEFLSRPIKAVAAIPIVDGAVTKC
jgi:hypothetical protein